ncbi:MAG: Bug family tripartite tricarboxylate transporter substrate binding protein [Rhodospirillales bacterium]
MKSARFVIASVACAAALFILPAAAQEYPSKPIKILTGFPPGGPTDIMARVLGDYLTRTWGQPSIVEARPGAAGNVAADLTVHAPPDGYTIYVGGLAITTLFKALYEKLSYDPEKDLTVISMLTRTPLVLESNLEVPSKNFAEFIALMKKEDDKLNYCSPGIGTTPHLAAELLRMKIGAKAVHVPYRGTAACVSALLKNEVQFTMDVIQTVVIQKDKVRPYAVTAAKRVDELPNVPTVAEVGMPDLEAYAAFALYGPPGMPKPLVEKIAAKVMEAYTDPASAQRLRNGGLYPAPMTTADTLKLVQEDKAKWVPVVKANNIKAE